MYGYLLYGYLFIVQIFIVRICIVRIFIYGYLFIVRICILRILYRYLVTKKRRKKKKSAAALAATQDVTMTSFENNVFITRFMTQHKEESANPGLGETDGGGNADASGRNNTPGAAENTETVTVKNGKDPFTQQ